MPRTRAMAAAQAAEKDKAAQPRSDNGYTSQAVDTGIAAERPSRKRKRTTKPSTQASKRTKKARLSRLLDMPPEVFNEVATHLLPADLLSLARSNKFFRKMFMSRTSVHLWKQALDNGFDIPPCPPELSEPQYVSLLFSKTCSSCGTKVLRRMDPYLYVRLCNSCRDEQIIEVSLFNELTPILPISDVIKEARFGFGYTSRSELRNVVVIAGQALKDKTIGWREERSTEMEERRVRGEELEDYLDMLEDEREMELELLKAQRREQIQARLLEEGWTEQNTKPSPDNNVEWNKLVSQPKPLTDRIWNNLYPKLIPLLKSNRVYNDELDMKNRRRDRIQKLQALVSNIRVALPPLVCLVPKTSTTSREPPASSSSMASSSVTSNSDIKVEQPFPLTSELLTWSMINRIVDDDILPEEVETRFNEIRDAFDRAVLEWRDKVERELVTIWNAGRGDETKPEPTNKGKGKGKASTRTSTRKTRASTGATPGASGSQSVELILPEFIATYTMPDGTSTTNISDLSLNLQLLLRADTVFGPTDGFILSQTYPAIVPRAVPIGRILGGPEELNHGDRWDANHVKRDDDMSAVAKKLLVRAGRPEATSVEMKALGINFKCGRCNRTLTESWEELVEHYTTEQQHYRQAQEKITAEPERGFVFHATHDLESDNPKPFAHLMTPQAAAEYMLETPMLHSAMMSCIKCQEMSIEARFFHTFAPGFESPIVEHLHDVHGVAVAQPGVHFQGWYGGQYLFDSSDEGYDSEEEWGILNLD